MCWSARMSSGRRRCWRLLRLCCCCCCCCQCSTCCEENGKPQYSHVEQGSDPEISVVKVREEEGGRLEVQEVEFVPGKAEEDKDLPSDDNQTTVTSPVHVEGVTLVTGATSQASWRLMPHSSSPDSSTAEATMTFSDEGAARRGSLNVVLIPQEVEESGGEETSEERTSTTFTISADHVLLT